MRERVNEILEIAKSIGSKNYKGLSFGENSDISFKDIVYLAQKYSTPVSGFMEVILKNQIQKMGFNVKLQSNKFPDLIVDDSFGIEVKSWFAASGEVSARFKEHSSGLQNVIICVYPWTFDHVYFGSISVMQPLIVNAAKLAEHRDRGYCNPPYSFVLLPPSKTFSGQKYSHVDGMVLKHEKDAKDAIKFVKEWSSVDYLSEEGQNKLVSLTKTFEYRQSSNFGKIDRIHCDEVKLWRNKLSQEKVCGYSISDWQSISCYPEKYRNLLEQHFGLPLSGYIEHDIFSGLPMFQLPKKIAR